MSLISMVEDVGRAVQRGELTEDEGEQRILELYEGRVTRAGARQLAAAGW